MPKYYIRCGELEEIVDADTPENACYRAVLRANGQTLGHYFFVDEQGFRGEEHKADQTCNSQVFSINTGVLPQRSIPYQDIINE